jgi:hypothetical protein
MGWGYKGFTWGSHGRQMRAKWGSHGVHMGVTWGPHGVHMGGAWVTMPCPVLGSESDRMSWNTFRASSRVSAMLHRRREPLCLALVRSGDHIRHSFVGSGDHMGCYDVAAFDWYLCGRVTKSDTVCFAR